VCSSDLEGLAMDLAQTERNRLEGLKQETLNRNRKSR
jgi:hypothetical protein